MTGQRRAGARPVVWIVDTAYTGELNARIGVAERLGYPYQVIPTPNGDAQGYGDMLWERYHRTAGCGGQMPLLVISGTGEETTSDIADLRAVFEDRLLNIYLASILPDDVHPRLFEYDLIASPQLTGANIVTTIGVPHKVTRSALTTALRQHAGFFARLPRPLIALLVGGNTRYCQGFDEAHAIALARRVSRIAKSVGGSVLVSNSRRTPENALSALLGQLTDLNPVFCDWQQTGQDFYHALLAHCDVFIATGDSLSMCSEVAYTGRPLLIDLSDDATEIYHRNIVGKLLDYGAARLLTERFEPWTYLPPDPTGAVAEAVSTRLTQKLTL